MQWSQLLYILLEVERAIVFDCMKKLKFGKRYLVTYYTYNRHPPVNLVNIFLICLPVPIIINDTGQPSNVVHITTHGANDCTNRHGGLINSQANCPALKAHEYLAGRMFNYDINRRCKT